MNENNTRILSVIYLSRIPNCARYGRDTKGNDGKKTRNSRVTPALFQPHARRTTHLASTSRRELRRAENLPRHGRSRGCMSRLENAARDAGTMGSRARWLLRLHSLSTARARGRVHTKLISCACVRHKRHGSIARAGTTAQSVPKRRECSR